MTFLADHRAVWAVAVCALLAAGVLLVVEWRRPDGRRRAARLGAALLAVAALASWALRPAWRGDGTAAPAQQALAVLWTGGMAQALPAPGEVERRYRFALPGANVPPDAGATFLPDAATLRRRFPELGRLHILGDGLNPADLPSLAGWRVEFTPGPRAAGEGPSMRSVRCPRVLPLGETLVIEGRVAGLPPGKPAALSLAGPTARRSASSPARRTRTVRRVSRSARRRLPPPGNSSGGFA